MDAYEGGSGGRKQKPCRACSDFKSWMRGGEATSATAMKEIKDHKANGGEKTTTAHTSSSSKVPSNYCVLH